MFKWSNIQLAIQGRTLLEDSTLSVPDKGLTVLMGRNGTGKTTLLRYILTQLKTVQSPTDVYDWVYQPQNAYLFKNDVSDNFLDPKKGFSLLSALGFEHLYHQNVEKLSGGEKQLILLIRTLSLSSSLYILDEPTAHLDEDMKALIYQLIHKLSQDAAILMVSHDSKTYFSEAKIYVIERKKLITQ